MSGDIPGAASKYIEESFDDRVVALWSSGAAGDQNPIYFQQTYSLREIRIKDYAKRGADISNAMPPGGEGLDRSNPAVARLMNQQRQMVASMGQFLAEEVMRVMRGIERTETTVPLYGSFTSIRCPGRERTNEGRAGFEGTYKEASPVEIRLGLLRVGDVMIGAVNAEVFTLDCPAIEAGVSVQGDDARHVDEWNGPAPGIFPTMRRSASTRSRSCHRGCSPDVPNRPSSTGSWASSTALDRRHTRSWRTDMRIVSIVSGAVLLCVSVAAAQTPRTTPAACDALRQLQVLVSR